MRTQFRDTQLNFGSGSNINADDIPETSVRKWLSTDFQEIAGEKIFDSPVQVSGSIFSSRDILAKCNIHIDYDGDAANADLLFGDNAYLRWDSSETYFSISHPLVTNNTYIHAFGFAGSVRADGAFYVNYSGGEEDSYIYFYDGASSTGQYLKWDDDPGQFEFSTQLSMGSNKIVGVTDPTNDQDAATKKYVDDVSGSCAQNLQNVTNVGDTTTNIVTATGFISTGDNNSADTAYTPMVLYDSGSTPPPASNFPVGTIYIQYTP